MTPVQRDDPYVAFNFLVAIDDVGDAGGMGAFSEVSGLEVEIPVIEYRNGAEDTTVRKLPGLPKYSNITLKRGITGDVEFWRWILDTINGNVRRANGVITLLNESRDEVVRWRFRRGWPCRYSGPILGAEANEVAIETLEIAHEGLSLDDD